MNSLSYIPQMLFTIYLPVFPIPCPALRSPTSAAFLKSLALFSASLSHGSSRPLGSGRGVYSQMSWAMLLGLLVMTRPDWAALGVPGCTDRIIWPAMWLLERGKGGSMMRVGGRDLYIFLDMSITVLINRYQHQQQMINLLQQIDFSKEKAQEPELVAFMKEAAKRIEKEQSDQILKFKKPTFDEDLENHLIVTNIPDLGNKERQTKFMKLFTTGILDKKGIGTKQGLESVEAGYSEVDGVIKYNKTLYIIYKNAAIAKKAYQKLHQLKFDKDHTLVCYTVREFREVEELTGEYVQPKITKKNKVIADYNLDGKYRDQFLYTIKDGNNIKVSMKWFDHIDKKIENSFEEELINLGDNVTKVVYSSKGTYIAACSSEGVRIYMGNTFELKALYKHAGATDVVFSPNETYMVSYNQVTGNTRSQENFILWDVELEISLTKLKSQPQQTLASFQFNATQTRLAIGLINEIVLYNCDSIQILQKQLQLSEEDLIKQNKWIKAQCIQKILWLPDNVSLTCVCYEQNPAPQSKSSSRIFIYNTETKEERKWRAIGQHIKKAEITVSDHADWVAVFFKKIQKKNVSTSVIYIVNLKKKQIETEVVEFKENVVSVSWDKQNARLGVAYELPVASKNDDVKCGVAFYQIQFKEKVLQAVKFSEIPMTPANRLILSQNGVFFALYNTSNLSWGKYKYTLGVFTKDPKTKKNVTEIIKKDSEIPYMTYFEMDSSGRFIITGTDKSYQIWTTSGELIFKDSFSSQIHNVHFRPRFINRLSSQAEAALETREKEIKKKYEEEDEKRLNALEYQLKKEKEDKRNFFKQYLAQKKQWFAQFKQSRAQIRGFNEEDPKVISSKYTHQYIQRN